MSTEVRSTWQHDVVVRVAPAKRRHSDETQVAVSTQGDERVARIPRAEFLAAVAAELDVIIINRAELPEVHTSGRRIVAGDTAWEKGDQFRRSQPREIGLAWLALAEYLDAHPPIDPADVESIAEVIRRHATTNEAYPIAHRDGSATAARADALARDLLATGRVQVTR